MFLEDKDTAFIKSQFKFASNCSAFYTVNDKFQLLLFNSHNQYTYQLNTSRCKITAQSASLFCLILQKSGRG